VIFSLSEPLRKGSAGTDPVELVLARLVVDPAYQRQGIGQKLMDWGAQTADKENLVAFLFARPAGVGLYQKNGWKAYQAVECEFPEKDFEIATTLAMIRHPRRTLETCA
jgi:GNAT superfamily N-acetyltransferase